MKTRHAILASLVLLSACGKQGSSDGSDKPPMNKQQATEEAIRVASTPFSIDGNDNSMEAGSPKKEAPAEIH